MKTIAFRFLGEAGEPTGYIGVASAANWTDLYWLVDEFGDPHRSEFKVLDRAGACWHEAWQGDDCETSEYETSCSLPFVTDDGWLPFPIKKVKTL